MLLFAPCDNDARVLKEARSLAEAQHRVTLYALASDTGSGAIGDRYHGVEIRRLLRPALSLLKGGRLTRTVRIPLRVALLFLFNLEVIALCLFRRSDVYHCHDAYPLLAAWVLKRLHGSRLLYDAHELFASRNVESRFGAILNRLATVYERMFIRAADRVVTVSQGVAEELKRRYRLGDVAVILNCPYRVGKRGMQRHERQPRTPEMTQHRRKLIYVGRITFNRGLKELVYALSYLPDQYFLVMIGPQHAGYTAELHETVRGLRLESRVYILPPVRFEEVTEYLHGAYLSFVPIEDVCLSYRYCLPNKLFESLHAGVPVLTSNLPEMRAVVERYGCGAVIERLDGEAIAELVLEIAGDEERYGKMVDGCEAAASAFCWENEEKKLLELYARWEQI